MPRTKSEVRPLEALALAISLSTNYKCEKVGKPAKCAQCNHKTVDIPGL